MNKYRDFRRRRDRGSLASTVRQQDGSIKIRLVHRAAINIPIKVGRASSDRLENVSSLSLYSMLDVVGLSRVKREKNFPGYSFLSFFRSRLGIDISDNLIVGSKIRILNDVLPDNLFIVISRENIF